MWADDPDKRFRFDADRRARLLLLIRAGSSVDDACDRVGCSPNTPRDWDRAGVLAREKDLRGETITDREREQMAFADDYRAARAEVDTRLIATIVGQSQKDWRAAAHLLALRDPKRYSERYLVKQMQIEAEAPIREAEREGKELDNALKSEKIAAIKEVRERGGRLMVVGAEDVFEAMTTSTRITDEQRKMMIDFFRAEGFRFVVERDLGAEPEGSEPMHP